MLGVCSSLRDQQFWFLNRLISSSYERDMIKLRKQKCRRKLQNFVMCSSISSTKCGGKEMSLKGGEREIFRANESMPCHLPMGGAWATREQRAPLAVGPTASHTSRPCGHTCSRLLSRAPSVLQPISWASELLF